MLRNSSYMETLARQISAHIPPCTVALCDHMTFGIVGEGGSLRSLDGVRRMRQLTGTPVPSRHRVRGVRGAGCGRTRDRRSRRWPSGQSSTRASASAEPSVGRRRFYIGCSRPDRCPGTQPGSGPRDAAPDAVDLDVRLIIKEPPVTDGVKRCTHSLSPSRVDPSMQQCQLSLPAAAGSLSGAGGRPLGQPTRRPRSHPRPARCRRLRLTMRLFSAG